MSINTMWKDPDFFHNFSTGLNPFSGKDERDPAIVFHSFHSPYYYWFK
ncbi:MAG: hypothetical protein HC866_25670 [Leptolyngbyaceae cyanobacterium RU_5_1]|nr:hypothetical protein [Leptolyngbyaceae cyanobacterium RU_5_1]